MNEEELLDIVNEKMYFYSSINDRRVEELFYNIDRYVKNNYLFEIEDDKYYLKYKDRILIIGFYSGPALLYYIKLAKDDNNNNCIDYDNYKNNSISVEQQEIKDQMDVIKNTISMLEERGISRSLIKKSIRL